jgi:transposase
MYHNFIGIDISKNDFVVAIHGSKKTFRYLNNSKGFNDLLEKHPILKDNSFVVLETTGGYEKALLEYLLVEKIIVHRANTRVVKHFIRSTGQLAKSDNIDAIGLARYGYERHAHLDCYKPNENNRQKLVKYTLRKQDLKKQLVAEKNRVQAPDQECTKESHQRVIEFLEQEIVILDSLIDNLIKDCEFLTRARDLLVKEVAGLGKATAISLLALMPELGNLNRKQVASLAGVAPYAYESGKKIGYRKTYGGRADLKPVLFMSAMTASRSNGKLGTFYNKLVESGKKKMVALIAVMRKIIVIANAKIRDLKRDLKIL